MTMKMTRWFLVFLFLGHSAFGVLEVKKGTFTRQTGTGNQAVSGVGFQPTAIIFFGTNQTSAGVAAATTVFYGVTAGSTQERGYGHFASDGGTVLTAATRGSATSMIVIIKNGTPTVSGEAGLVSFDTDGFTVNWSTNDGTQNIIHYFAVGGDADSAFVGDFNFPITTGNFSVTGVGFTPKIVFMMGMGKITAYPQNQTKFEKSFFSISESSTERGVMGYTFKPQVGTFNKAVSGIDNNCIITPKSSTQNETIADLVSMDSDGFTINASTVKSAYKVAFLALGGNSDFSVDVGVGSKPFISKDSSYTGTGFQPESIFLINSSAVTMGTNVVDGFINFGAYDGTNTGVAGAVTEDNPTSTIKTDEYSATTKVIRYMAPGDPSTIQTDGTLKTFDTDGFTINFTPVNTTAKHKFVYLVMKGGAAPVSGAVNARVLTGAGVGTRNGHEVTSLSGIP